jgi:hypothetical protein
MHESPPSDLLLMPRSVLHELLHATKSLLQ